MSKMNTKMALQFAGTWSAVHDLWFKDVPGSTLDDLVSGKTELVVVSGEDGVFRFTAPGGAMAGGFKTAEGAKLAADLHLEASMRDLPRKLVIAADLDPEIWKLHSMDRFVWFAREQLPDARIERHASDRWVVYCNGSMIGIARSPHQGVEILTNAGY